jgi:hypothetical protein
MIIVSVAPIFAERTVCPTKPLWKVHHKLEQEIKNVVENVAGLPVDFTVPPVPNGTIFTNVKFHRVLQDNRSTFIEGEFLGRKKLVRMKVW